MAWEWVIFGVIIAAFLAIDLLLHRRKHARGKTRAIVWSIVTVTVGLSFGLYVWQTMGLRAAEEYLAGYLLEESLSLDNLFVFLIIFRMMRIPTAQQGVALNWGIFGALVLRGIFIFLGAEVLNRWAWLEYFLVVLLLLAGWRALRTNPRETDEDNKLVEWLQRHLAVSAPRTDSRFFVREQGRLKTTPLFVAILALELSDVMFAIDSVPAVFSITREPFIVYTSNIFAILGLRSLYVVVAHTIVGLRYLHYGLAIVLAFAALKILLGHLGVEIVPLASVGLTVGIIGTSVVASLFHANQSDQKPIVDSTETANQ